MEDVLKDFYAGRLFSRSDLENELERWKEIVADYEAQDVYPGDSYYQNALENRDAYQEAIDEFENYYTEDGTFIG